MTRCRSAEYAWCFVAARGIGHGYARFLAYRFYSLCMPEAFHLIPGFSSARKCHLCSAVDSRLRLLVG